MISRILLATLLLALGGFGGLRPVAAQGFVATPMKVEFDARPGDESERQIQLTSSFADRRLPVKATLVHVQQQLDCSLNALPLTTKLNPTDRSCADWVSISTADFEIPPLQTVPVTVRIRVPPDARGYYAAGLQLRPIPPPGEKATIKLAIQFQILLAVTVRGLPASQRFAVPAATLTHLTADATRPGSTLAAIRAANTGETLVRVGGTLTIQGQSNTAWLRVAQLPLPERGILPGAAVNLGDDLKRRLPAGRYRLIARLTVNGMSYPTIEREVDFAGDPAQQTLAVDVPLRIEPPDIALTILPGSRRTANVMLHNPSTTTVQLTGRLSRPQNLDPTYEATDWLTVTPDTLTLRGGERRTVRITAAAPADGIPYPNYYAQLLLSAVDPAGQGVGDVVIPIILHQAKVAEPRRMAFQQVQLVESEDGDLSMVLVLENTGAIHLAPTASVSITNAIGKSLLSQTLTSATSLLLPGGTTRYSGPLLVQSCQPGQYICTVAAAVDGQQISKVLRLSLTQRDGRIQGILQDPAPGDAPAPPDATGVQTDNPHDPPTHTST